MAQAKWLKLGAAAFLSVGMLTACGGDDSDSDDGGQNIVPPNTGDELDDDERDGNVDTDPDTEIDTDTDDDEDSDDDSED